MDLWPKICFCPVKHFETCRVSTLRKVTSTLSIFDNEEKKQSKSRRTQFRWEKLTIKRIWFGTPELNTNKIKDFKQILTSVLIVVPFVSLIFLLWWDGTEPPYFSLASEGLCRPWPINSERCLQRRRNLREFIPHLLAATSRTFSFPPQKTHVRCVLVFINAHQS